MDFIMATVILIIIYLSFIGLGLPSSLLGSAWPIMQADLGVPLSSAGIISLIISGGMIVSSFFSGKLIARFKTENVTLAGMALIAIALLGYWSLPSFVWLCVAALPLGLGSGAIDTALNHYVALHYKSSHMNWLHCFWGAGATLGPVIMSVFIAQDNTWRKGYLAIAIIHICAVVMLVSTLPLWKRVERSGETAGPENPQKEEGNIFNIPGLKITLISFFFFCALEATVALWGSTYLVNYKNIPADIAARWLSIFFIGITAGRFVAGFVAMKLKNSALIRIGLAMAALGTITLLLPLSDIFSLTGLLLTGLGCAPVIPCMLQGTPDRFGEKAANTVIGYQMAFGFMGSTFMPPIMGMVASRFSIIIFPVSIFAYTLIMLISTEAVNRLLAERDETV